MRILPSWLRTMVSGSLPADDQQLADELTLIGIAVEGIDRSGLETVFEMEITTNRVDAMNHYGIAREISAIYDLDLPPLSAKLPAAKGKSGISVEITAAQKEVQQRFAALDQKPINNAADATNFVMLLMGKPTHAFDADKLEGG